MEPLRRVDEALRALGSFTSWTAPVTRLVLYSFTRSADGGYPEAGVIIDSAGDLYGTTTQGGTANLGVVYKLDATAVRRCYTASRVGKMGVSRQEE